MGIFKISTPGFCVSNSTKLMSLSHDMVTWPEVRGRFVIDLRTLSRTFGKYMVFQ